MYAKFAVVFTGHFKVFFSGKSVQISQTILWADP